MTARCPTLYAMRLAAAAVILLVAAPTAAAGPKTKVAAKGKAPARAAAPAATSTAASEVPTSRLRHETIGIGPGYGSIEAGRAELARKDDDTAIGRSLTAAAPARAAAGGPFAAVETTVAKKRPQATGRIRVSLEVDRRGRVRHAIVVGFDRALDRAIETQLESTVLPREYAGQQVDTVLAFQRGKLLRR